MTKPLQKRFEKKILRLMPLVLSHAFLLQQNFNLQAFYRNVYAIL